MEQLGRNKEKIKSCLFYLGLSLELLIVLVDKSALSGLPEGQLFRLTFVLFALKVCLTRYSLKEWLWMAGFVALGGMVYLCTGENVILRIVVFVAAMKGIELKRVLKYVFWVTLAGSLLIVVLSFAGFLGTVSISQEFRTDVFETRYCFGMGHPNALHCMFLMLVLLFMYTYWERLNLAAAIGLFAANLILYYFTDSKTGGGMTAMAIIMAFILQKGVKLQKALWVYVLGMLLFAGCIGISVWAAQYTEQTWADPLLLKIYILFSGRMSNLYWGTEAHAGALVTWKLFSDPGHLAYYFDMGWVRMFYWYGIVPGIIFAIVHILLIRECYRKADYMGLMMIASLAMYTIVEAHIISDYIARNYILFLLGAYWSDMFRAGSEKEEYLWKGYRLFQKSN